MKKKFKILSIDGGGIRGVLPCQILADAERDLAEREGAPVRLVDYFDMICGTSIGGLMAIGLSLGMPASEMSQFFEDHGEDIFPASRRSWPRKFINLLLGSSFYDRTLLKKLLRQKYNAYSADQDARLGDAMTRLIIPAYNAEKGVIYNFRTAHAEHLVRDYQVPAVDVALSTAAAPIFFRPYSFSYVNKGTDECCVFRNMIDGGLVANNPAFIGLLEAVTHLQVPLESISLLSLGTGSLKFTTDIQPEKMGSKFWTYPLSGDGVRLYNAMMSVQSEAVDEKLKLVQEGLSPAGLSRFDYLRIQHPFKKEDFVELDDARASAIQRMEAAGHELYAKHREEIQQVFLQEKKSPFVPYIRP